MKQSYVSTTRYTQNIYTGYGNVSGYVTAPEWKYVLSTSLTPSYQTIAISKDAMSTCCNAIEFSFIVVAWSIARIFRCGKLGKMTYAQLVAKHWKRKH